MIIEYGKLFVDKWWQDLSHSCAIITDDTVRALYGDKLKQCLPQKVHLFSVPPGEGSKSRECKQAIEDAMLEAGCGRDCTVIALGGGVMNDLAGFVAATFCRGIPYVSIPTTLLAQVDASIGGKVAVNTARGKNLIGAYHLPRLVFIDRTLLHSLSPEEIQNGMAEVIKYAVIASSSLFERLEEGGNYEEWIEECVSIKKRVVEKDYREEGLRRILNFGHTFGHAIESSCNCRIKHGQAVALGILAESYLSYRLGLLKENVFQRIEMLIKKYRFDSRFEGGNLMPFMQRDKKAAHNKVRIVCLHDIGVVAPFEGEYCTPVDPQLIEEGVSWLCKGH